MSDSSNAAFQEIDEAVRQDDLKAWWKRWGGWVVAGVVLVLVAVAALVGWRQYQNAERAHASVAYSAAIARIADDPKAARADLERQAASAPEPYRELAALAAAQLLDTPDQQVEALLTVAPKLSPELSDLALALAGYHSVDGGKLGSLAGQLEAMTGPQRAFRISARELQSLEALHKGDLKTARDIWQEIIRDPDAPPGAPQRAQAMLLLYPAPAETKK